MKFKKIFSKIYSAVFVKFSKKFSRKNLRLFLEKAIDEYAVEKKAVILNIGAGGETTSWLRKKNLKFKELDINPALKPDYVLSIENMHSIPENSVDIIFLMEVLHHVQNPFNAVSEMNRILMPGGLVIGSTAFVFPICDAPYDFFRYTKYGIINLFKKFECLKLAERNSYFDTIYVILLRLFIIGSIKEKIISILLFPFYIILLPIIALLNMVATSNNAATGYFFIFKK
jgi:SAM-dependent methyltransferase